MELYFISNILPMEVVNYRKMSVAGAKFQVSLAEELYNQLGGHADFLSIVRRGNKESKILCNRVLFSDKQHDTIWHINKPFLEEVTAGVQVFFKTLKWILKNRHKTRKVLMLNAPNEVITPVLILQKFGLCEGYSILIDSPFVKTNQTSMYIKWRENDYKRGLKKLSSLKGVILLNKNVPKLLDLKTEHKVILLGYEPTDVTFEETHYDGIHNRKKKLMYAGTLSYVNGIEEMLNAFTLLPQDEYQLDICGYGPMEDYVREYAQKHSNCTFHGRVSQEELDSLYSDADLMINLRLPDDEDNDYSFPSKIIGYLYSGTLVLSTDFSSLPDSYRPYVVLTDISSPHNVAQNIQQLFNKEENELNKTAKNAREFIINNQSWEKVVEDIIDFFKQ